MNNKRTDAKALVGFDLVKDSLIEQLMLFKLVLDQRECKLGGIDGDIQLREYPRKTADVIFVSMGEDNRFDRAAILKQVGNIGNYMKFSGRHLSNDASTGWDAPFCDQAWTGAARFSSGFSVSRSSCASSFF